MAAILVAAALVAAALMRWEDIVEWSNANQGFVQMLAAVVAAGAVIVAAHQVVQASSASERADKTRVESALLLARAEAGAVISLAVVRSFEGGETGGLFRVQASNIGQAAATNVRVSATVRGEPLAAHQDGVDLIDGRDLPHGSGSRFDTEFQVPAYLVQTYGQRFDVPAEVTVTYDDGLGAGYEARLHHRPRG